MHTPEKVLRVYQYMMHGGQWVLNILLFILFPSILSCILDTKRKRSNEYINCTLCFVCVCIYYHLPPFVASKNAWIFY